MDAATEIKTIETHKTFRHTFLNWVIVKINYLSIKSDNYDAYKRFFETFPGLEFSREAYQNIKAVPIKFKTEDGNVMMTVDDDFIQLRINGQEYANFANSVVPYLKKIADLIEDIAADVPKIELRKVNLWGYRSQGDHEDGMKIMKLALSEDLIESWEPKEQEQNGEFVKLTRLYKSGQLENSLDFSTALTFGYIQPLDTDKFARVILDISSEATDVKADSMLVAFDSLNNHMFEVFVSAVSETSINVMENE